MKNAVRIAGSLSLLFLLSRPASDLGTADKAASENCVGFTVIEAGKGLNCKGDTVRLVKTYGYYQLQAAL